ncbi:MAG: hypothetical protein QOF28_336 [Actinomycetota bacterium]|nr:hypothetical protein [Actinomycetota bacterium]
MIADRVVEVIEEELDRGVVGVAVAVVAGTEVQWSGAFGRLDVERTQPVTTDTVFPLQSVSKPIVATAFMHWVERGAVGLDDPVNRHLAPLEVRNEWEQDSPVTIRQLLTHTAGLPVSLGWGASSSIEQLIADEVHTEARPGTRLIYANWGYDIVGYLAARLAGTTKWDEAVADAVLRPLGMMATTSASSDGAARDVDAPTGHAVSQLDGSHLRLGPPPWPVQPGPPSGALVSTVGDLARFLIAHLNGGGPALRPDTVADMHRVHAALGNGGGGMGLGFRVDSRGGRPFFCHGGDGSGFTTFVGGHPDERVGAIVLLNVGGAQEARSRIARAALESALGDANGRARTGARSSRPATGGYLSTYWGMRAEVSEEGGVPVVAFPANAVTFAESVSRLTEVGGRWRADGGMFDGFELDFEGTGDERSFVGGLYPFEFVADDTTRATLPVAVDETGDLFGRWAGVMDTPIGPVPLDLTVDAGTVTVGFLGTESVDTDAETANGWIRARFAPEVAGFGVLDVYARLGLTEGRLQGLLYARHDAGEFAIPTVLEREGSA